MQDSLVLSRATYEELMEQSPYDDYVELEDDSMNFSALSRYLEWFFSKLFGNKVSYSFMRMLPYLIILLVVVLIALKVAGLSVTNVFKPQRNIKPGTDAFTEDTPIHIVNFEQLIAKAIKDEDFRLAIRYSYLKLLQELDKKELIQWEKHKSNYDYLMAIRKQNFATSFNELTQVYENAWYGELPWSNEQYHDVYGAASALAQTISHKLKS